jgi:hypothetical protein
MIAYKLMKLRKNGTLGALFIGAKNVVPVGQWLKSECIPTKGFAVRQGWHCTFTPYAPHLSKNPKNGCARVWVKVEVENFSTYDRPESQGGQWILADRMKVLEIVA